MSEEKVSLKRQTKFLNNLRRSGLRLLTGNELKVLTFLIDRTIGYNESTTKTSTTRISKGFNNRDGGVETYGTGIDRADVQRILKRLEELCFITTSTSKQGTEVEINFDWQSEDLPLGKQKTNEKTCRDKPSTCRDRPSNGAGETPAIIQRQEKHLHKDTILDGSAVVHESTALKDTANKVKEKIQTSKKHKEKRIAEGGGAISPKVCEDVWRSSLMQSLGSDHVIVAWTGKEKGQLKHLQNKLGMATKAAAFMMFIEFTAKYWDTIMDRHFRWATEEALRSEPSIGFVLKFTDGFARAYNDRAKYDEAATLLETVKTSRRGKVMRMDEGEGEKTPQASSPAAKRKKPKPLSEQFKERIAERAKQPKQAAPVKISAPLPDIDVDDLPTFEPLPDWEE